MITTRYAQLIQFIASCNGNGREELQARIDDGEISDRDAAIVYAYATIKKIDWKLDSISEKAEVMQ